MSHRPFARLAALMLALLPLVSLSACGGEPTATPENMAKASASLGSANGLCPVMERLVTADGGSTDYKGQKIAFCCPACIGKFRSNPDRYIAAMKADPAKYGYKP